MSIDVSLKDLLETGAHFGHQTRRWNPKMEPFIYGSHGGVHIFDLVKTKEALQQALEMLEEASRNNKKILLVGTKKQAKQQVAETAQRTGIFYVNERFMGGSITNFEQVQKSIKKLDEMKNAREAGEYNKFTKKERLLIDREIERLERFFSGLAGMTAIPDLLIVIDTRKEFGAVNEASKMKIDIIGIVDTNSDPAGITCPIPMNDDAVKAIDYVLSLFEQAILEGRKPKKEAAKKTVVKKQDTPKTQAESKAKKEPVGKTKTKTSKVKKESVEVKTA